MTLRGTFRDGVVYVSGGREADALRNGDSVEITPVHFKPRAAATTSRGKRALPARKPATKIQRLAAFDAAFGMWKDRKEWAGLTSVEVVAGLRRRASERRRG